MVTVNITGLNEVNELIKELSSDKFIKEKLIRIGATSMNAVISSRIQDEGKAADETDIGEYSKEHIYVNPKNSPKSIAPLTGKFGTDKFKNGNSHRSKYFDKGYDEFKSTIGRNQIGKVNLTLTGTFINQFKLIETEKGWGLGWSEEDYLKMAKHFEKKYGKSIFALSINELEKLIEIIEAEIDLLR